MAIDILIEEAKGISDDKIMEVVRFLRFIKSEDAMPASEMVFSKRKRSASLEGVGTFWISDDFDKPLEDFKEYMG